MGVLPQTDLQISDVQAALGVTTSNLSDLCTHENINEWSEFKPGYLEASILQREILYQRPQGGSNDPYKLGDFRGYYHDEVAPTVYGMSNQRRNTRHSTIGTIDFSCMYKMFNKDLSTYIQGYDQAELRIHDGAGNYITSEYKALSTGDTAFTISLSYNGPTTYIIKACLTNGANQSMWVKMPGNLEATVEIYQFIQDFNISYSPYDNPPYGNISPGTYYLDIRNKMLQRVPATLDKPEHYRYSAEGHIRRSYSGTTYTHSGYIRAGKIYAVTQAGVQREIHPFYPGTNCPQGGYYLPLNTWSPIEWELDIADLAEDEDVLMEVTSVEIL